jgi:hypothetical protein
MRLVSIFLLFTALLNAQENSNVFTLKPSLGLNGCQIHGDSYSGYDKLGLFIGTSVNARLNGKTSFEIGFYFSQKGARHNQNPKNNDYTYYRVNLNYIDLPLSLRFHVNPKYFITLGPSFAYLISYTEATQLGDWTGQWPFNKSEIGLNIGLGRIIKDRFSVEIRSSNSIVPVRDYGRIANLVFYPNPVARFFNKGLYNNILTLMITYQLNFRNSRENG